jgi:hypothetical protein
LMHECGMNDDARQKFLSTVNAPSVDKIHPANYPVAINLLQAKRRAVK